VLSFGKHKGKYVFELDTGYLKWMVKDAKNVPPLPQEREAAAQELIARGMSVSPVGTGGGKSPAKVPSSRNDPETGNAKAAAAPSAALLLSVKDVAKLLGVSVRTVWRMRKRGQLPDPMQLSEQTLRWRREEIEQWVASGRIVLPEVEVAPRQPPTDDH
jgi:excisionase family DNA binding protein